ncbi:MAG: hypothetical protein M1812_003884 [Candelaria pacifica]|nr:MAG: hypothetical protein M1812_003884 [Candelaria pacifica]
MIPTRSRYPRASTDGVDGNTDTTSKGDESIASAGRGRTPNQGANGVAPTLFHRVKHDKTILALAVSGQHIFGGTEGGEILVWSLEALQLKTTVQAHRRSVLSLFLSQDQKLLFSSAGDAIVHVWCTETLKCLYNIYSTYDVGDVFCVVYSSALQTVYCGAQNTSIQWYDLKQKDTRPAPDPKAHPSYRYNNFFDSKGPGGVATPRPVSSDGTFQTQGGRDLEIDKQYIKQYAHYGYVYCMLLSKGLVKNGPDDDVLISGGGDGNIKLWSLDADNGGTILELDELPGDGYNSVLTMALDGTFLYSGLLEGEVNVWDLDTRQQVRSVKAHLDDVLSISVGGGFIFSAGATGNAKKFNHKYECITRWRAHEGLVLASAVTSYNYRRIYVTGGNDHCVSIWDVDGHSPEPIGGINNSNEQMINSLSKLIAYKTVSSDPSLAEECRRGATFLRNLFKRFGATTDMFNTDDQRNPVVYAKFKGGSAKKGRSKRILFYGHYDVIAADNDQGKWIVDPFSMEGINGYLYGRGVSDNKGPVLAALYAVGELLSEQSLDADIIFLIEGEEECGSRGFEKAIRRNKEMIGDIDWILLANSYWIDDEVPCLTYGLRGVVHATVQIESEHPDLHSGVDGSELMDEPLKDLVMLLAILSGPHGRVQIPGFYNPVLPVTEAEEERYAAITKTLIRRNPDLGDSETLMMSLQRRWREPSLTIHRFHVSGPENSTIIPRLARAALSIRLVPDQDTLKIQESLTTLLEESFRTLESKNSLSISIDHRAEPWLGDPDNEIFQTLEKAIMDVWGPLDEGRRSSMPLLDTSSRNPSTGNPGPGPKASPTTSSTLANGSDHTSMASTSPVTKHFPPMEQHSRLPRKPLYIREGGSIPAIRFLEKEFKAPAAHLPCGQASDSAHLDNERMRVVNLYNSREIFKRVFRELPKK